MAKGRRSLQKEQEEEINPRPVREYRVIVRSVVESIHTVTGRSPVEARLNFHKLQESGDITVLGVVQSSKVELNEQFELDSEVWEVTSECDGPGCPVFWSVRHKPSGIQKTKRMSIREAHSKVVSDLARRGLLNVTEN